MNSSQNGPIKSIPEETHEYSMGTTPVMAALQELISGVAPVDTVCINAGTLVRNCFPNQVVKEAVEFDKKHGIETNRPGKILYEEAKKEIIKVATTVCQMLTNAKNIPRPHVLVYHAIYEHCIPRDVARPRTDSKRHIDYADTLVSTDLIRGSVSRSNVDGATLMEIPVTGRTIPWRLLTSLLHDIKNDHNVVMVSSHPVDYHLGSVSRTFRVVRSYTGKYFDYKHLGEAVFGTPVFPFNIYTHAVLGDKEDVKSSLSPNARHQLEETAVQEDWKTKTKDYVKDRLYKLGIRIPTTF